MFIIDSISKSYGRKKVLSDISFTIGPGECIGLLGLNGSGKSTLLSILAGCLKTDSGNFYYKEADGNPVSLLSGRQLSSKVSFLPQENPLIDELSGYDNLLLWYDERTSLLSSKENQDILHQLGVDTFIRQKVKNMSGGMKKRLSLAIAMLSHPELLLLDEPLAALDLLVKNGILTYLKQYVANGGSIILATHETSALDICTSIYSLKSAVLSREELSGGDNSQYINILLSEK